MPAPRKIFRIELMNQNCAPANVASGDAISALHHQEILTELKALYDLIERRTAGVAGTDAEQVDPGGLRKLKDETNAIHRAINRTKQEIAVLHLSGFNGDGNGRVARELDAVVHDAECATHQLLDAAEEIDQAASALSAMLKHQQQQELAQDIQDQVIRIFEACNFQDLGGQRIAKVLATLKFVEDHIARMMEIWDGIDAFKGSAAAFAEGDLQVTFVNGPKLDGEPGHASQHEVDELFGVR